MTARSGSEQGITEKEQKKEEVKKEQKKEEVKKFRGQDAIEGLSSKHGNSQEL